MAARNDAARQRITDEAAMWCDLVLGQTAAVSARFHVTRRAELYVRVAGLPLANVLDALEIDEDGWAARLAELRTREAEIRAAHAEHEAVRSERGASA